MQRVALPTASSSLTIHPPPGPLDPRLVFQIGYIPRGNLKNRVGPLIAPVCNEAAHACDEEQSKPDFSFTGADTQPGGTSMPATGAGEKKKKKANKPPQAVPLVENKFETGPTEYD